MPFDIDRNTLVLFSGGMDSTIALYHALDVARRNGGRVHALSFSYGQRHSHELGYARTIVGRIARSERYAPLMGNHVTHRMHFPLVPGSSLIGGEPVTKYHDIADAAAHGDEDNSFIPYRNLILLSQAAMYAFLWRCSTITTGLRGGFSDCTSQFEDMVEAAINCAVPGWPVVIDTPTHMSREDCLALARSIPECVEALAYTLTCFEGTTPPCGHCLPCLKRAEGFKLAGIDDPLSKARHEHQEYYRRHMPPFNK